MKRAPKGGSRFLFSGVFVMRRKIQPFLLAFLAMGLSPLAWAVDLTWKNSFSFYGDNTEFFEPFRTGETLLGQQGKSRLQAAVGKNVFVSGGVFGDFRSVENPEIALKPLLSIEYRSSGTRFI